MCDLQEIFIFTKQHKLVADCIIKCPHFFGNLSVWEMKFWNIDYWLLAWENLNIENFVELFFIAYIPLIQQKEKERVPWILLTSCGGWKIRKIDIDLIFSSVE